MIKYSLICKKSHEFEGWFSSSGAFEQQVKKKLVTCPACGSPHVTKALMAPSVVTSEQKAGRRRKAEPAHVEDAAAPQPAPTQLAVPPEHRELIQKMRKLRDEILGKSEYVGPRFAEEARRIHTEPATAPRGIYGEASPAEVESLAEDGIEVFPIPVLPGDQN